MVDEALIEQLNRGYVCPADAGPAWRAACEYGFDMSLVEDALLMAPEQRIEEHQRALNLLLEIEAARESNDQDRSG
ncbi:MAG: hypothetical protein WCT12_13410 [Verrucomicrobiota bacterium]